MGMTRGNLYERRPGVWVYRVMSGRTPDGRRRTRSATIYATSRRDADRQATKIVRKWDEEHDAGRDAAGTFGRQVADWQEAAEHAPTTRYSAGLLCERIRTDLGAIKLTDLTARDLDLWYRQLAHGGMSANTILHHHAIIRAVLAYAFDWDQVDRNVALKAHPPKPVEADESDHVPTPEALAVMLQTVKSRTLKTAILLGAATGMRRGEICALRWADLRDGALWVQRSAYKVPHSELGYKVPKNRKSKVVALNAGLLVELERFRSWQQDWQARLGVAPAPDAMLLAKLRADPTGRTGYRPDWLSQEWQRLCAKHGVAFKFHGLRHMHGSMLVDSGVSLTAAAARQGHSVQTMSAHYLHPINASALAAAAVIDDRLALLFPPAEIE